MVRHRLSLLARTTSLLSCLLLTACALITGPLTLERSRLEQELAAIQHTTSALQVNTPGGNSLQLFLGYDLVNQALAGLDGFTAPIPGIRRANLTIGSIRLVGHDGTAEVRLCASAQRGRARLEVALQAILLVDTTDPAQPVLRLRVQGLAPVFSWRCFRLDTFGLATRLLTAKADQLAIDKLKFPMPMSLATPLSIPAVDQPVSAPMNGGGTFHGVVHRPALPPAKATFTIRDTLFLRDGLHLLVDMHLEPPTP